jgi:stress response protein SCP2
MSILDKFFKRKIENEMLDEVKLNEVAFELEKEISAKCTIQINWSHSINEALKNYDCSFDDTMYGLDLYALELKNEKMLDDSSLLFYNSKIKTDNGKITSNNKSIICHQGISLNEGFNDNDEIDEKYDGIFIVDLSKIELSVNKLIFFIGRPKTDSEQSELWIDKNRVSSVLNEKAYVDIFINERLIKSSCPYYYNKFGALRILELENNSGNWKINLDNQIFENGLQEIINQYK